MNKKGQVMVLFIAIFAIIAIISIFVAFSNKYSGGTFNGEKGVIGSYAAALINAYQIQEEQLIYLDELTKNAAYKSILITAEDGGLMSADCKAGVYFYWNDETKTCFPDANKTILNYFETKLLEEVNTHNYFVKGFHDINLKNNETLDFIGFGDNIVSLPIEITGTNACKTSIKDKSSVDLSEVQNFLINSPAKTSAQVFLDKGDETGIDPVFALAFFKHESQLGTLGVASRTRSIGNIRPSSSCQEIISLSCINPNQAPTRQQCLVNNCAQCDFVDCPATVDVTDMTEVRTNCFCGYNSWDDGIRAWFDLINGPVYIQSGKDSLEEIVPVYAPSNENNVQAYITSVKSIASYYKNLPCKSQLGTYTYRPSFRTSIEYNLSVYESLETFSKEAIIDCKDDVANCLDKKIDLFNQVNNEQIVPVDICENGPEKLFRVFSEKLTDCQDSWGNNCKCRITEPYSQSQLEENNYVISFNERGNWMILALESPKLLTAIAPLENIWYPKSLSFKNDGTLENELLFATGSQEFTKNNFKALYLLNNQNSKQFVVETWTDTLENALTTLPNTNKECIIPKSSFNLCAKTGKILPIFDDQGVKFEESKIKFSLKLDDTIPPQKVQTLDAQIYPDSIVLTWNQMIINDLVKYELYYDSQNFIQITENDKKLDIYPKEELPFNSGLMSISSHNMNYDTLYYEETAGNPASRSYFLRINPQTRLIDLTKENFFAIVGVDNFNNRNDLVEAFKMFPIISTP